MTKTTREYCDIFQGEVDVSVKYVAKPILKGDNAQYLKHSFVCSVGSFGKCTVNLSKCPVYKGAPDSLRV